MSGDAYAQLTAAIDGALDRGEAEPTDPSQIVVCTDGPGYVAERRRRGVNLWQTGSSCGAFHPNDEVAALLEDAVGSRPNDLDGKAACEIAKTRGRHLGQTVVFRGEYLTDHMEKAAIRPIGCDVAFGLGSLADDVERRIQSADPPPWISPQRRMIAVFTGLLTQRGRDGLQFYRDDGIRLDVTSMTDLKVIGAPRP
jgi:hypothetical protein